MIRIPNLKEIKDTILQKLLQDLFNDLRADVLFKYDFRFMEVAFTKAETLKIKHGLSFAPKDILVTSKIGAGNYTINYDQTDGIYISITSTGAVRLRLMLGRYE